MSAPKQQPDRTDPVREAFNKQRPAYVQAAWLSTAIGLMMLVPSWYMFEVYGRVLNSRNHTTLAWLLVMVLGVYLFVELLDLVRGRLLHNAAAAFEMKLRQRIFDATFQASLRRLPGGTLQPFNDLKTLKEFLSSSVVPSFMDIPTAMLCLVLLFAMSPWLGAAGLVGALIQVWLIWLTEKRTMPLLNRATAASIQAQQYASGVLRNAQVIESMGMLGRIGARWQSKQRAFLVSQGEASDYAGVTSAAAKLLQMMQGSVLLGGASWLAMHSNLIGGFGMVIVASIIGGRALQPLAQLVPNWRLIIQARDALARVSVVFGQQQIQPPGMPLPPPRGVLTAEAVVAGAPGQQVPILRNVSFAAMPGELTLVIGPTASGKSTLARLLVGVWPTQAGKVRLDGADVHGWDKQQLGPHIGYLPQAVELFDGTVKENIARFGDVDMKAVEEAVELAGMTEVIQALPEGYDTRIGDEGAVLSGGQRQRLGLARALYGKPRLLVLDEPNANLDAAGDQALLALLLRLKAAGTTMIVITHRNTLMPATDKLLVLREGQVVAFGPRDDVMAALNKANQQAREAEASAAAAAAAAQRDKPAMVRRLPVTQSDAAR
jgi:ATP-binding cassette, subfamily C, bacterial exporter for protease/lipase